MSNRKRPDLAVEEKQRVLQWLLQYNKDGVPNRGAPKEATAFFNISVKSVRKIWVHAKKQIERGEVVHFQNKRKGKQHVDKMMPDEEKIRALPVKERSTIRRMAAKLGISKSLLGEWIKEKQLRAHTSAVKPFLTDDNKLARLRFSLSQLNSASILEDKLNFHSMHNVVHIDEKWFYMSNTSERYYLLPDEESANKPRKHQESERI
ncbi:uncharacterized protein LOC131009842 [Salvia miltiorrhiza]|uniref:uncharacterized protein LOC131009842 n=1 Tax=Salvia miltiorrhiza TaxID=226208 RepID=UPI0025AC01D8|nr:uncharacterized protein LOC131009842 [Salvia miltiorrhiza]